VLRQQIAEARPGWTMAYIDSLTWREVDDLVAYLNAKAKAADEHND
jgi:hypothetical protein